MACHAIDQTDTAKFDYSFTEVKCDYSVQRIVTITNNLTASKHVTIRC